MIGEERNLLFFYKLKKYDVEDESIETKTKNDEDQTSTVNSELPKKRKKGKKKKEIADSKDVKKPIIPKKEEETVEKLVEIENDVEIYEICMWRCDGSL